MDQGQDVMTVEEVAIYLRVSDRTVYNWAKNGEIPSGKLGSTWRFSRKAVEHWVHDRLGHRKHRSASLKMSLDLRSVWQPEHSFIFTRAMSKTMVLDHLIECLAERDEISNKTELYESIYHREKLMSTGIGIGVAVPHARLASVKNIVLTGAVARQPITDYPSLDGEPVSLIFMIAAGHNQHNEHIKLLSAISTVCKDPLWRERLLAAKNADSFYSLMTEPED